MNYPTKMPPIRAVLDRSAIESYGRGHMHVGELITEIDNERAAIGIPATALLEAHAGFLADKLATARLAVLTGLPGTAMLNLDADAAEAIAPIVPHAGGDLARSHAVWAAREYSAVYLTSELDKTARLVDEDRVIAISPEEA
jgi:hypothetical protein